MLYLTKERQEVSKTEEPAFKLDDFELTAKIVKIKPVEEVQAKIQNQMILNRVNKKI